MEAQKQIPKRGDKNFEALRPDKTALEPMTKKECIIANYHVACHMIKAFRYRPWMTSKEVVGPNGEMINNNGRIYIPEFRRKIKI